VPTGGRGTPTRQDRAGWILPRPGERLYARVAALVALLTLLALIGNALWITSLDSLDLLVYHCYAAAFWQGAPVLHQAGTQACAPLWSAPPVRYHSFPHEYPPLALAVFSLPLLCPWWSYSTAFVILMAACLLLATAALLWRGHLEAAIGLPVYALLAGWSFTLERYDLLVGLGVLASLWLAQRGRLAGATVALALATALKLLPVVLLPLLLIWCKRQEGGRWRLDLLALFAAIVLVCEAPALLLDPSALWSPLQYEFSRPLHIESLGGVLLWLSSNAGLGTAPNLTGGPYMVFSYNSLNVAGGTQAFWGAVPLALGLAAAALVYRRAWRGEDSLGRGYVLLLLAVIASGKVLSPQYLLWLLPAVALVEGPRLRWIALSCLFYFIMYCYNTIPLSLLPNSANFITAIVLRDLLLWGLVALYAATPGDRKAAQQWPARSLWSMLRLA
jgi:uncharacterized membrane protein